MAEEKWEYTSTFISANVENEGAKEYIQNRWPKWTDIGKFSPETMIPLLNSYGSEGWELVNMEPVAIHDKDMDIGFAGTYPYVSHCYFCVFKRKQS